MAVRYGSKQYYKEKYEDKCRECRNVQQAFYNLKDSISRIYKKGFDITSISYTISGGNTMLSSTGYAYVVQFSYIDKHGDTHLVKHNSYTGHPKVNIIYHDEDTALIYIHTEKHQYTLYLDKEHGTLVGIPEKFICTKELNKECFN